MLYTTYTHRRTPTILDVKNIIRYVSQRSTVVKQKKSVAITVNALPSVMQYDW
jgi:hypothetical protein